MGRLPPPRKAVQSQSASPPFPSLARARAPLPGRPTWGPWDSGSPGPRVPGPGAGSAGAAGEAGAREERLGRIGRAPGYLGPQTPWCGAGGSAPAGAPRVSASGAAGRGSARGAGPAGRPGLRASRLRLRLRLPARRVGLRDRLTPEATRLPSPRSVFIGFQCSKITGFPHCFLLFIQRHGNHWIPSISKTKGFPANFTLRNP